jgi:hypothetical protein
MSTPPWSSKRTISSSKRPTELSFADAAPRLLPAVAASPMKVCSMLARGQRDGSPQRALQLLQAAQEIATPDTPLGKRARQLLQEETGLSPEGVDLALDYSLEHSPGRSTLLQLGKRLPECQRSHVLLPGNVFVAAFRAILLAVLQADECFVRPSSRARTMTALLCEASPGAFRIVEQLRPDPGDHVWAYGSNETLAQLRADLPRGVFLHAHGSGMAVAAFVEPRQMYDEDELWQAISGLTTDVILFDQRGCLSPRLVLVQGSETFAQQIAHHLVDTLTDAESIIARGSLSADEQADILHYETIFTYLGAFHRAGQGGVTLDPELERFVVPPVGRYLHITRTSDALGLIRTLGPHITSFGTWGDARLEGQILAAIGRRRVAAFGTFQQPELDGPVDLRPGWTPETLR